MLVGVDIGGTFTDLVLSTDGRLSIHKLPSTPADPSVAMLAGLEAITGGKLDALQRVVHGSTVATNAILERKGARTALIVTQGFRDILFIGRQNRPDLYAIQPHLPLPLISREHCFEVPERLDHTGAVLRPLDIKALDKVLDVIVGLKVDSVAVCCLYSYVNPQHEQAIRDRIMARGILDPWLVALSSDVLPEFREYERASTVALEAYVRPVMGRYIGNLETSLKKRNKGAILRIMKSDGGVISAGRVRQQAIQTALSGPAAGVIGAYHLAQLAGHANIITLDMGGTSTDVAICPGQPIRRPQSEMDGLPLRIRLLDIETVGAGGGSIARLDAGGALRVGPESAGADPGPAVYGHGGKLPTVSDANAILGRLDPDHFLGGGMKLDLASAEAALGSLAKSMGLSLREAAQGIVDVANVNIDRAVRRVSVSRGYDPRDFTLLAFGGAGGLHACAVAERLQIPRVLIPRYPGVLCAFGLLVADVVIDYSRSVLQPVNERTVDILAEYLETMIITARDELKAEGVPRKFREYIASMDMRYQGQAYELNIPATGGTDLSELFHEAHYRTYGHSIPGRTVEIVNLRLQAVGRVTSPELQAEKVNVHQAVSIGQREKTGEATVSLYERDQLAPGATFMGPALVFQMDSTSYVPPRWSASVDAYRNLLLDFIEG